MRRHLVVMVKEPRPGLVKSRLGREIGATRAAWWFRHQTDRLLRETADPRWRIWLAVSPDREGMTSRVWPAGLARLPQGRGDLGRRMARVFAGLPPGPALIVGADIPGIDRTRIARAFAVLGSRDAVLGPAGDGGYWLIGLKRVRPVPTCFLHGVRWSTRHALSDTLATMAGLRFSLTERLDDVDDARDLARLSARQRHYT